MGNGGIFNCLYSGYIRLDFKKLLFWQRLGLRWIGAHHSIELVELRWKWFFHGLRIYPLMINYVSKVVTYLKEEKTFQNRGKAFQNQQNIFLIVPFRNNQERVPKTTECVLDRSTLERFPFFENTSFFLKKFSNFSERVLHRYFLEHFSLGIEYDDNEVKSIFRQKIVFVLCYSQLESVYRQSLMTKIVFHSQKLNLMLFHLEKNHLDHERSEECIESHLISIKTRKMFRRRNSHRSSQIVHRTNYDDNREKEEDFVRWICSKSSSNNL